MRKILFTKKNTLAVKYFNPTIDQQDMNVNSSKYQLNEKFSRTLTTNRMIESRPNFGARSDVWTLL
jgi:hypothetical protein